MLELAAKDVGDDLHVTVRMRPKPLAWRDRIIVQDPQRAPLKVVGVVVVREAEVVIRLEPAEVEKSTLACALHGELRCGPGFHRVR